MIDSQLAPEADPDMDLQDPAFRAHARPGEIEAATQEPRRQPVPGRQLLKQRRTGAAGRGAARLTGGRLSLILRRVAMAALLLLGIGAILAMLLGRSATSASPLSRQRGRAACHPRRAGGHPPAPLLAAAQCLAAAGRRCPGRGRAAGAGGEEDGRGGRAGAAADRTADRDRDRRGAGQRDDALRVLELRGDRRTQLAEI
ncbi:hypothetical protein [Poseidonocella sp. HB161398]|uniref:hypothetical protein n=1 Tax=Poseidonocella sp. HB161398 TaxID=2320855 RepID=UPI001108BCEA|nr:hypothetical protein [Poseidonocella sp. HB161398]